MSEKPDAGGVAELAEAIDCARLAAEAALDTTFETATVGYGGRSMMFFSPYAVLKICTHRPERSSLEVTGLDGAGAAAHPELRIPVVLGHDELPGSLSWVATTRLAGTLASSPEWQDEATTLLLGQAAARLHGLPTEGLPEHRRRIRDLPTSDPNAHEAGTRLAHALAEVEQRHVARCAVLRGFVHGDFSGRNVMLSDEKPPGVIDFEGCGVGCTYDDLATLVMQDGLLGNREPALLLRGYEATRELVDRDHLRWHLAWRARWVLQWAVEIDQPLAAQVTALVPHLIAGLAGAEAVVQMLAARPRYRPTSEGHGAHSPPHSNGRRPRTDILSSATSSPLSHHVRPWRRSRAW